MFSQKIWTIFIISIVGSVVECSPATRAARVRFPDDARLFVNPKSIQNTWQSPKKQVLYYEYFCFLKLPPSCRQFSKKPFNSITLFRVDGSKKFFCKKVLGGAGYRSRYLSHAKRALYHLSYAPIVILLTRICIYQFQKLKGQIKSIIN